MPYIPDVHTNDQISASGWGNLIRNAVVTHFATLAERNSFTSIAPTDLICYVAANNEFYIKGATGWLTLFSRWRTYNPVVFIPTGGSGWTAWTVAGQGPIASSNRLNTGSYARYRLELDTCYFMSGCVFDTAYFAGMPIGQMQVYLPDFPSAVHNVPAGQGNALAYWNSAGSLRSKWMGGGCFMVQNTALISNQLLFNGAYIPRVQEDVLAAANVQTETGGGGYTFPGIGPSGEKSGMYVSGSFQMTGLAPG